MSLQKQLNYIEGTEEQPYSNRVLAFCLRIIVSNHELSVCTNNPCDRKAQAADAVVSVLDLHLRHTALACGLTAS